MQQMIKEFKKESDLVLDKDSIEKTLDGLYEIKDYLGEVSDWAMNYEAQNESDEYDRWFFEKRTDDYWKAIQNMINTLDSIKKDSVIKEIL